MIRPLVEDNPGVGDVYLLICWFADPLRQRRLMTNEPHQRRFETNQTQRTRFPLPMSIQYK